IIEDLTFKLLQTFFHTPVSAATAAAATGAIPIPFSDAAILVPEQIAMLAKITSVFGISMDKASIASVVSATIGTAGTTVLGKTVVAGLLKLIPGAGSVTGGAISAVTAAALTAALGEAYISIMCMVARGDMKISDLSSEEGKKVLADIFKQNLKIKRNSKGIRTE
ncbi:MAG: DUF697 domain-containing protein, partial [Clostridiales bacterium]|nr:DUF697 domain-containing protein [Clostridiales bacterium]